MGAGRGRSSFCSLFEMWEHVLAGKKQGVRIVIMPCVSMSLISYEKVRVDYEGEVYI